MKTTTLLLSILWTAHIASAQTSATNTGILYVSNSTNIFYAGSDFTNNSTAALTNNGELYVKGNLSNAQASMATGSGTLFLNGASAQSINGTQVFKTFNLNTNNTSGITLNNNLSVSGTHTFTAGLIASSATPNYLIYETGSTYSGATDARHVTGWVKKMGTTDFTFPVGNNSYLREVAMSNLSAATEMNVTYSGATTNTSNVTSPVGTVNQFEHWTLNKISGGTAQVTLNWDKSKVNFPAYNLADILSAKYTTSWVSTGGTATGNITTTGSITSTAQTTFGPMVIGSTLIAVPLNFLQINAKRIDDFATVEWKTANEYNVAWHEVQRSSFGNSFFTIGKVNAKNSREQTYQFVDTIMITGTVYYRIKSVDLDGKLKYSTIVSVSNKTESNPLALVANPAKNRIQISGGKPGANYQYSLYSTEGRTVQKGLLNGTNVMSIPLGSNIIPGTYILTLGNTIQTATIKVVVE